MIKTFRHKGLSRFFMDDDSSLLNAKHLDRISRMLDRLDAAEAPQDMNLPGYGLHKLSGDKKGFWSIKVSGNWRITFKFEGNHTYDVNLEDYH
jgi:proteic killer suppression protein